MCYQGNFMNVLIRFQLFNIHQTVMPGKKEEKNIDKCKPPMFYVPGFGGVVPFRRSPSRRSRSAVSPPADKKQ